MSIFKAGIEAADPYQAVRRYLKADRDAVKILVGEKENPRAGEWPLIHLIAFGKAACPMMKAALEIISPDFKGNAIAVTNYENVTPIDGVEVIGAGHPLPDKVGFAAAKRCAGIAKDAKLGELVLVLVSGGGSALIPYPVDPVTLEEKIHTTELLLASGADINQINCVRKHLSQLKGGGLARLAAPADLHALILSDVIGDDLSTIASGPTVPDETTFNDAIAILNSKGIWRKLPDSVRHYLQAGQEGRVQETPKAGDACFARAGQTLIGSNRISIDAMMKSAQESGFKIIPYTDALCGEAREAAQKLAVFAAEQINNHPDQAFAVIAGGETTVTLKGEGKGGRNQELALAFAHHAEKKPLPGNWVFLSGGTDGRDGPTEAAGGAVDSGTIERICAAGADPYQLLENNDSHAALKASNDLLLTGATGTNVADLQVLLISP